MLYRLLEVYCPHLKSAGQVSAPRRECAPVPRVGLEETAHPGYVNPPVLLKKVMCKRNLHQVLCPLLQSLQGA